MTMTWTTQKKMLRELKEHPNNPRKLTTQAKKQLIKSFKKFGYAETIAINLDGTILAGHQRLHIMSELGWFDKEIDVRVPSRQLTEEEAREYLIRSNQNTGDWDFDLLASEFDTKDLLSYGFEEKFLLEAFEVPKFDETSEEDQPDLSKKKPKKCPNCGHSF